MREPVIVDVVRTTFGKSGGALSNLSLIHI